MYKLRIGELLEFERLAGMTWNKASQFFVSKPCKPHRLALQGARTKSQLEQLQLAIEIGGCKDCVQPDPPMRVKAAIGYLAERRENPQIRWEAFLEGDEAALDTALGKAMAAMAAEAAASEDSSQSTAPGSGPSSTSSPDSRPTPTES